MGTRFRGWPEQAYPVLLELDGEPSRETRERVRRHREEHVRQPMIDLLNDLADVDPRRSGGSASGLPDPFRHSA